jgi:hypothetical protein
VFEKEKRTLYLIFLLTWTLIPVSCSGCLFHLETVTLDDYFYVRSLTPGSSKIMIMLDWYIEGLRLIADHKSATWLLHFLFWCLIIIKRHNVAFIERELIYKCHILAWILLKVIPTKVSFFCNESCGLRTGLFYWTHRNIKGAICPYWKHRNGSTSDSVLCVISFSLLTLLVK